MCFFCWKKAMFLCIQHEFRYTRQKKFITTIGQWLLGVWKKGKTLRRTHRPHPRRGNQAITPISVFGVCGPYDIIIKAFIFHLRRKVGISFFWTLGKKINTPNKLRAHTTPLFPHTIHTREIKKIILLLL